MVENVKNVTLKPIERFSNKHIRIYNESFPEEERRPLSTLHTGYGRLEILSIEKDGEIVGFLTWWNFGNFRYVEHFAVDSAKRGQGIGREVIKQFVMESPVPVVLEVELPGSSPQADRRIAFYKEAGFIALNKYRYIQPSYSIGLPEVPMMLMMTSDHLSADEVSSLLFREVYGRS